MQRRLFGFSQMVDMIREIELKRHQLRMHV